MGHQGIDHMMDLLRERVYWPSMAKDVQSWFQDVIIVKYLEVITLSLNQK